MIKDVQFFGAIFISITALIIFLVALDIAYSMRNDVALNLLFGTAAAR